MTRASTPVAAAFFLLTVDLVGVVATFGFMLWIRSNVLPSFGIVAPFEAVRTYATLWPVLALVVVVRWGYGLYPGHALAVSTELRLQTFSTFLVAAFVFVGSAVFRFAEDYSRFVLASTTVSLLFVLPIMRAWAKWLASRTPGYGLTVPVSMPPDPSTVEGRVVSDVADRLARRPALGVHLSADGRVGQGARHVLLVDSGDAAKNEVSLEALTHEFASVWFVPNWPMVTADAIEPRDLGGVLAIEVKNRLLVPRNLVVKRLLDLIVVLATSPVALVLGAMIALSMRLTTPGPVLIEHRRVGRRGRPIVVRKFRSMVVDADDVLARLLATDPDARREWDERQKLRNDPRVTNVGKFLRRTSLDELPQLWNVLEGSMSLVGPRPVTKDELHRYGPAVQRYLSVTPGLTGLAQISGRSELSYEERVKVDARYVRTWSIWLDLEILARSVGAILSGRGAF